MNLLLVEDNHEMLDNYKEIFEYFFNQVYTASDGEEALKVFSEKNINIVFTDYEMPNLNGYDLTFKLQEINPNISITIMSNYDDRERLQKCIPLNLEGYLFKPLYYEDIKNYLIKLSKSIQNNNSFEYVINKNINTRELLSYDKSFTLTKLETEFLNLLLINKNRVIPHSVIYDHLFDYNPTTKSIIDLVYRIKKKYGLVIKNIKDHGYLLVVDDE
jgi:YesN/AraC family two-component response regulator